MNALTLSDQMMIALHGHNVYTGFDWEKYPTDLTGGQIYPVMEQIVKDLQPEFVVEVGSWKGKSAIHFASLLKKYCPNKDVVVLCIDTWLGSDTVHMFDYRADPTWGMPNVFDHGYPRLYFQFLANVCVAGMQDIVVPFPNTSNVAVKWLDRFEEKPGLIYIDSCHDEEECYLDILRYWHVLRPGGIMIGDDWSVEFYGVICAVVKFAKEYGLTIQRAEVGKWIIQKPFDKLV
jgi:hypothetical protein